MTVQVTVKAADGAQSTLTLPAPVVTSPGSGPSFPLLGVTSWGNADYGANAAKIAKYDLANLNFWPGWLNPSSPYSTPAQIVANLHSRNPKLLIGNYVEAHDAFATSSSSTNDANHDVYVKTTTSVGPNGLGDWLIRDATGAIVYTWGGARYCPNYTSFVTADANGYRYPQWKAHRDAAYVNAGIDIWFVDDNYYKPRWTCDYNRDGTNDAPGSNSSSTPASWWRAGCAAYYDAARPLMNGVSSSATILMANADNDLSGVSYPPGYGQFSEYKQKLHGVFLEAIVGENWSAESNYGFAGAMGWYKEVWNNLLSPQTVLFSHHNLAGDGGGYQAAALQQNRYALAFCLMNNGYYMVDPGSDIYGTTFLWYDEYDLAGRSTSKWLGAAIDAPQTAAWSQGVWMRRFQNGLVLCNPKGNGSKTVTPPAGYTHFTGTQSPSVNNGAAVTGTVTLADRDGLLLVKTGTNGY